MKKYTLKELNNMPTLHQGHTDDLKLDENNIRVWLSRMTIEDGIECNNEVTIERYNRKGWGGWELVKSYEAK